MTDDDDNGDGDREMHAISDEFLSRTINSRGPGFAGATLTTTLAKLLSMMDDDMVDTTLAMHVEEVKRLRLIFIEDYPDGYGGEQ